MGQCPSKAGSVARCYDDDGKEDHNSSTISPSLSCNAGLPLEQILKLQTTAGGYNTNYIHRSGSALSPSKFLQQHTPDRNQKCILDPTEVQRTLEYQADEMLARDRRNSLPPVNMTPPQQQYPATVSPNGSPRRSSGSDDDIDDDQMFWSPFVATPTLEVTANNNDDDDDADASCWSSKTDLISHSAQSALTTWSTSTKPIENLGRRSNQSKTNHRNNFSVIDNLGGPQATPSTMMITDSFDVNNNNPTRDAAQYYNIAQQKRMGAPLQQPRQQQYPISASSIPFRCSNIRCNNMKEGEAKPDDHTQTNNIKLFDNKLFDTYENITWSWGVSTVPTKDKLQQHQIYYIESKHRREEYMSVLHLKMKAHLGFYYTQRYLPVFPDAPAPIGISPDDIEAISRASHLLVRADTSCSSMSVDSQSIDFGSVPPATQIKSYITDIPYMDLAITGSLGLVARRGHTSSRRKLASAIDRNQKSPDHYIVMINRRSGVPLAVCATKSTEGNPVVRMFATKPRVPGQRSAATTNMLGLEWGTGNYPLYAWAEIATDGIYPDPVGFSLYMALGSGGKFSAKPCYQASFDDSNGHPTIKVSGRTDKEVRARGCAIIDVEVDEDAKISSHESNSSYPKIEDLNFRLQIAQGIDPALMICFTAVVDEVMEKSMRLQARYGVQRRRDRRR